MARARRTSTVHAFWVVPEDGTWTGPFTVNLPEGREAIALFSGKQEAMIFDHLSEQGAKGNVRQTTTNGSPALLYGPWAVARVEREKGATYEPT
jgi:hypothetical protein